MGHHLLTLHRLQYRLVRLGLCSKDQRLDTDVIPLYTSVGLLIVILGLPKGSCFGNLMANIRPPIYHFQLAQLFVDLHQVLPFHLFRQGSTHR